MPSPLTKVQKVLPLVEAYLKEKGQCYRQELVAAMEAQGFSDNTVDQAVKLLSDKVKKEPSGKEHIFIWVDDPSQESSPI